MHPLGCAQLPGNACDRLGHRAPCQCVELHKRSLSTCKALPVTTVAEICREHRAKRGH